MVKAAMYQTQTAPEWDTNSLLLWFHLSGIMNGKLNQPPLSSIILVMPVRSLLKQKEPPSSFLSAPQLALMLPRYWYCQATLSVSQGKTSAPFPSLIPSGGANGQYNILINCCSHTKYHSPPGSSVQ